MKTLDESFIDWEGEAFGFGYGNGEQWILHALKEFMHLIKPDKNGLMSYDYIELEKEVGGRSTWFLINVLCRMNAIDYGSSPRVGFLSKKGNNLRDYIISNSFDYLYDVLGNSGPEYFSCYLTSCNCEGLEQRCKNNHFF